MAKVLQGKVALQLMDRWCAQRVQYYEDPLGVDKTWTLTESDLKQRCAPPQIGLFVLQCSKAKQRTENGGYDHMPVSQGARYPLLMAPNQRPNSADLADLFCRFVGLL